MALITTSKGLMPEEALRRVDGQHEDENELATWVEFYDGDELVHRSASVHIKEAVAPLGAAADFGD